MSTHRAAALAAGVQLNPVVVCRRELEEATARRDPEAPARQQRRTKRNAERTAFRDEMESFTKALEQMERKEATQQRQGQGRKDAQENIIETTVSQRLRAIEVQWEAQMVSLNASCRAVAAKIDTKVAVVQADEKRLRQQAEREAEHARARAAAAAVAKQQEEMMRRRQELDRQRQLVAQEEQRNREEQTHARQEIARQKKRTEEWAETTKADTEHRSKEEARKARTAAERLMQEAADEADKVKHEAQRDAQLLAQQARREREETERRHAEEEEATRQKKIALAEKHQRIYEKIAHKVNRRRYQEALSLWTAGVAVAKREGATLRRFAVTRRYKSLLRVFMAWRRCVGQRGLGNVEQLDPKAQAQLTALLQKFKLGNLGPFICNELGVLSIDDLRLIEPVRQQRSHSSVCSRSCPKLSGADTAGGRRRG